MLLDISAQIEKWRSLLLDTTKRNRLISFRTGRAGGVPLVHPDSGQVWRYVVGSNKPLTFRWKRDLIDLREDREQAPNHASSTPSLFEPDEKQEAITASEILERCRGSPKLCVDDLLTELSDKALAARLMRLALNARESLTERGVTILYLAFGFLRWFESPDSQEEVRSPLLLVPVRLERDSVESPWQLQVEDEEILPNHTLAQRLLEDFKLRLPMVEDEKIDTDDPGWRAIFFNSIRQCIYTFPHWEVQDQVALGTFNFQKLAIWEDLGRNQNRISSHEVCRAIAGDRSIALRAPSDLPRADELDEKTRPHDTHHILDADSSQHAAIVAATRGANLVVDGPPGTGKSQTIANTISEFLASGKTVLFVSEKAAALEVVKRRLEGRRIGDFCLELHSHKANKRAVVAELGRCLNLPPETYRDASDDLTRLFDARSQLNSYAKELHSVRQPLGRSAFRVHEELSRLARLQSISRCPVPDILTRDEAFLRKITELLAGLLDCRSVIEEGERHPWMGCRAPVYSVILRNDVEHHFKQLVERVPDVLLACSVLQECGFVRESPTRIDWLAGERNAQRALRSSCWWEPSRRKEFMGLIQRWIEYLRKAKGLREALRNRLASQAFAQQSTWIIHRASRYRSAWRRLLPTWWILRHKVKAWYSDAPDTAVMLEDLQHLSEYQNCRAFCRQVHEDYDSDLLMDDAGKLQLVGTLECLQAVDSLEQPAKEQSQYRPIRDRLTDAIDRSRLAHSAGFDESWEFLTTRLFDPAKRVSTGITISDASLAELQKWLTERAADAHRIYEWIRFRDTKHEMAQAGVGHILDEVIQGRVKLVDASDSFRARFLRLWLDAIYEHISVLRQFTTDTHERLIERFRELDRRSVESAPSRIRNLLLTDPNRPSAAMGDAPGSSELGTLLREVNKKRRHLPLRKLFAAIPTILPRLKPCLMMSPLAVSTYLQSPDLQFDLVIFDEASQVRPHDSISAIYRGRKLLVAGDQKQLPPTNIFERALDAEDVGYDQQEEASADLADFESVLDVCCALGIPRRRLLWHYRSRREGLIAFSNRHFYRNELVTFPSVYDAPDNPAITFDYVEQGRWKSGRSGGFNIVDARRTAELVVEHFRRQSDQSLGVIAFGEHQQMRILDELEHLRHANPDLEEFYREDREEPFFVKNLESVQGDERDVIFLNVGYGPDETGRVALNFGPLNRPGGERRLNVAVTRARNRMTLVSSLRAQDIDLSRTSAVGTRLLRAYLEYAERGIQALWAGVTEDSQREFDSPFEQEVHAELTRRGLTVHRQVGCSGFRIDLVVVDPCAPGRYLLGVECDGSTYHSSATARDRDRLRQEVLESLGWQICRVWSTDWVRDYEGQVRRVLEALEKAQKLESRPPPIASPATVPVAKNPTPSTFTPVMATSERSLLNFDSIHDVPDATLGEELLRVLRTYGATNLDDLFHALARQLGFQRTGKRIQARLQQLVDRLIQTGQVGHTGDGRLQIVMNQ
jgi:very-short-patch-repair endonuclease